MENYKVAGDSPQRALPRNLRQERMRDDDDNGETMVVMSRCKTSKGIVNVSKNCYSNTSSYQEGLTKDNTCSDPSSVSVGELLLNSERNRDKENLVREQIYVNPKSQSVQDARNGSGRMLEHQRRSYHEPDGLLRRKENGAPSLMCADSKANNTLTIKQKIPRPANAFMLFANEWRKKLAAENPRESNKDISVRLGILWKNMAKDTKEKYFTLAREVDAEHKRKYPDTRALTYLNIKIVPHMAELNTPPPS